MGTIARLRILALLTAAVVLPAPNVARAASDSTTHHVQAKGEGIWYGGGNALPYHLQSYDLIYAAAPLSGGGLLDGTLSSGSLYAESDAYWDSSGQSTAPVFGTISVGGKHGTARFTFEGTFDMTSLELTGVLSAWVGTGAFDGFGGSLDLRAHVELPVDSSVNPVFVVDELSGDIQLLK